MGQAWKVLEPGTTYVPGGHIDLIAEHLEAVSRGKIHDLLINIPPRHMKSLLVSVMWPAWVWTWNPEHRFLSASYALKLAIRDTVKSRRLIQSAWYQERWGNVFRLTSDQNEKSRYENNRTGYRLATSVDSAVTGEGAATILVDDPHNVRALSETKIESAIDWWDQSMSTRLDDPNTGARVMVMQRVHERDLSGHVLSDGSWTHLMLPAEFEPERKCRTPVGEDWRTEPGELLAPERFDAKALAKLKRQLGAYGCNPYEAPILMADLTMRPIGEIEVGDRIVGFDKRQRNDGIKGRMKLTEAEVLEVHSHVAPVVKMTLSSGEVIRCTRDHRWYTKDRGAGRDMYGAVVLGRSSLARVCPPALPSLTTEEERLGGWLSGFFDGEGSVSHARKQVGTAEYRSTATITFYQGAGRNLPLCEKLESTLEHFGFSYSVAEDERKDNKTAACYGYRCYRLTGNDLPLAQRFLHIAQPTKWRQRIIDGAMGAKFIKGREKVISIEPDGEETVYALTTTTGNYVVWGLASSNSAGQLQQRPSPAEGGIFKRHWWQFYERIPSAVDEIVHSWDMAFKATNDSAYVVGQTWARIGANYYLVWQTREKLTFTESCAAVKQLAGMNPGYTAILIEDKANGPAIIDALRRAVPGILPIEPDGSKEARAHATSPTVEAGNVYLPSPRLAPWIDAFVDECANFPNAAYADQVDCATQAIRWLRDRSTELLVEWAAPRPISPV